ncbi:S-adenosyl-L-methionine-dependent methyltransferase [Phytophthora cactorum]|nr:S-adenosyl-L-methionine-dependent methyltransferase [Phytophthora cactorum]
MSCCPSVMEPSKETTTNTMAVKTFNNSKLFVAGPRQAKAGLIAIPDIFGPNSGRIKQDAEALAKLGYAVVLVDAADGDYPVTLDGVDMAAWLKRNSFEKVSAAHVANAIAYLQEEIGVESISSYGYCWGAYVGAKQSALETPVVKGHQRPPLVSEGGAVEKILKANASIAKQSNVVNFSDMIHGWVCRGDIDDPATKEAVKKAWHLASEFIQTINPFIRIKSDRREIHVIMPEYLVFFVHQHFDFRYPELEALLTMQNLPRVAETVLMDPETRKLPEPESSPLVRVQLPSAEHAKFLSERGILVKGVYEVWGHTSSGGGYEELVKSVEAFQGPQKQRILQDDKRSWRINVSVFGKKLSMDEQRERREKFRDGLPFAGPVQMKNPDETFLVLEELGLDQDLHPGMKPKQIFFLRELAGSEKNRGRGGARDLVDQQTLKRRAYIGPRTGSVLIPCGTHGAMCYGTDIDIRVLLGTGVGVTGAGVVVTDEKSDGKERVNVITNFKQYGLPLPELVRADNSMSPLVKQCEGFFDAVVCDPPYGIRAGARKSGRKRQIKSDVSMATKQENYIAPTQPYAAEDVMKDLLEFAAQTLREGGRLVYLLPTTYEYTDSDLPRHPSLQVIANSEQKLTKKYARRLITMVKRTPTAEEMAAVESAETAAKSNPGDVSFANLREKIRKRKHALRSRRRGPEKGSKPRWKATHELIAFSSEKSLEGTTNWQARMASMSLSFILCESEEESAPRTGWQRKGKSESSSAARQANQEDVPSAETQNQSSVVSRRNKGNSKSRKSTTASDRYAYGQNFKVSSFVDSSIFSYRRQHHVRQLQNMRQRRYRERKKLTASALQVNAEKLHQENGALETAILEHFKSQV